MTGPTDWPQASEMLKRTTNKTKIVRRIVSSKILNKNYVLVKVVVRKTVWSVLLLKKATTPHLLSALNSVQVVFGLYHRRPSQVVLSLSKKN